MRELCFSAGVGRTNSPANNNNNNNNTGSRRTASSRSYRSINNNDSYHSFSQQKRTLDEFPMDHSFQDTQRFFQHRRMVQAENRQNLVTNTSESKQLSSYSRKRFETALTIKDEESLPPPSPEERTIFWDDVKPRWRHRRQVCMSARPVPNKHVALTPRPGSEPPGGVTVAQGLGGLIGPGDPRGESPRSRPVFNHLRGNNRAYPTIRRLLLESNEEYRVVCPTSAATDCKSYDRPCRRSSADCSSINDYLLIPIEDDEEEAAEAVGEDTAGNDVLENDEKQQLQEEMLLMAHVVDAAESIGGGTPRRLTGEETASVFLDRKPLFSRSKKRKGGASVTSAAETDIDGEESAFEDNNRPSNMSVGTVGKKLSNVRKTVGTKKMVDLEPIQQSDAGEAAEEEGGDNKEEEGPESPWHCWVDDATVSSIASKKSDPEVPIPEASPAQSPVPEVVPEPPVSAVRDTQLQSASPGLKGSRKSSGSLAKKSSSDLKNKMGKGKRKGGKQATPEPVEEIVELPPPPPPPVVEEVVEEVKEEEAPPEPVLPSYICPSSVIKSTQTEIKLWLHKSTFSAANRLLPIY